MAGYSEFEKKETLVSAVGNAYIAHALRTRVSLWQLADS